LTHFCCYSKIKPEKYVWKEGIAVAKRTQSSSGSIQLALFLIICLILGSAFGLLIASIKNAPAFDDITFDPKMATVVYDVNNKVITRFYVENRTPVPVEKIAPIMRQAIVAIEDTRFYDHHGVDAKAILRAIAADIRHRDMVQGGSTITQQLARNAFLSHDKTFARKFSEAIWAVQIERKYTKEEILEKYLNQIYFGHGAYGIEAASQLYFNKPARELELPEAALLAGLPKSPYYYSPHVDKDAALRRRNTVLARMAELGTISDEDKQKAQSAPLGVVPLKEKNKNAKAPYFSEHVLKYLLEHYDQSIIFGGGLKIYTTLDL
jgi:penicillin-binding protein 1A